MHATVRWMLEAFFIALLGACGGNVAGTSEPGDAGHDAMANDAMAAEAGLPSESGMCEGTPHPGEVPIEHRPIAVVCSRTQLSPGLEGGPTMACNADSDCTNYGHCAEHECGYDTCLVDADCANGSICVCSADVGSGLRAPGNVCIPAGCRIDSDCGNGQYCAPSRGYCGNVDGFNCTSPKDTCVVPAQDCSCGGNACIYAPSVGQFVCATSTCSG